MPKYPEHAGAVNTATSQAAAVAVEARGKVSREKMIYDMLAARPRSRGQLCETLGLPVEVVGPRLSEMKARGLLRPTGETVTGKWGLEHDVLEVCGPYSPKKSGPKIKAGNSPEFGLLFQANKVMGDLVVAFGENPSAEPPQQYTITQQAATERAAAWLRSFNEWRKSH